MHRKYSCETRREREARTHYTTKQNKARKREKISEQPHTIKFVPRIDVWIQWMVYCAYWMIEPVQIWWIFGAIKSSVYNIYHQRILVFLEPFAHRNNSKICLRRSNIDKEKWRKVNVRRKVKIWVKQKFKIKTWHTKNCPFQVFTATIGFILRFFFLAYEKRIPAIRNRLPLVTLIQFCE